MNWLLISALGFAAWVSVLVLLVALCRAAAPGDEIAAAPASASSGFGSRAPSGGDGGAIDLHAFRSRRSASPRRRAGTVRRRAASA